MAEEKERQRGDRRRKVQLSELQKPRDLDLDLDLGSGHTAYHRASVIDFYLHTKFEFSESGKTFCERTDVRTYERTTDGYFFSNVINSTRNSQPKMPMKCAKTMQIGPRVLNIWAVKHTSLGFLGSPCTYITNKYKHIYVFLYFCIFCIVRVRGDHFVWFTLSTCSCSLVKVTDVGRAEPPLSELSIAFKKRPYEGMHTSLARDTSYTELRKDQEEDSAGPGKKGSGCHRKRQDINQVN